MHEPRPSPSLAPWAQHEGDSRGREHFEDHAPESSPYRSDRARIVRARSFRDLGQKTRLSLGSGGEAPRTYLCHTAEVSSLARRLAGHLKLNEDLAECIALARDLGKAPFGRAGENALRECMVRHGGFDPRHQSLRAVEELEIAFPEFNGLNLTWEVREGLLTPEHLHASELLAPKQLHRQHNPGLEAQVVALADEIIAVCSGVDDGLESGFFTLEDLSSISLWKEADTQACRRYARLSGSRRQAHSGRTLLDILVRETVSSTENSLAQQPIESADSVRKHQHPLALLPPVIRSQLSELHDFLSEHLYHHPTVRASNRTGAEMVTCLFDIYSRNPHFMGFAQKRVKKDGVARAACDHVAGLTDIATRGALARLETSWSQGHPPGQAALFA